MVKRTDEDRRLLLNVIKRRRERKIEAHGLLITLFERMEGKKKEMDDETDSYITYNVRSRMKRWKVKLGIERHEDGDGD